MSQQSSSSSFESIFNAALEDYAKRSGTKLDQHHPLVKHLENCNSVDSISSAIQKHARRFREFRGEDGKMMKSLKGAVQVLHSLSTSTILGEGISIPLPPSKAVLAAFGVLLGAVKDVSASCDALIELFDCIKRFLCRLEIYTNIALTTAMTVIVVEKLAEVLSVLALATKYVKQGQIKKFMMKIIGEDDIEALLKRLDRSTREEGVAAGAQLLGGMHDLVQHTRVAIDDQENRGSIGLSGGGPENTLQNVPSDIKKSMRAESQQNMQRWLSPPDPWKNHNIARESQHSGTATWWIRGETFTKWKSSGPSSLLWLHGKPGAGKSILCSSIIQDIQSMCASGQASLAFFYCDFREDQKKDGRGLLSSLLVQLCDQSDAYHDALFKLYLEHKNGSRHAGNSELAQCLKHVLEIPEQVTVYVIIDALDECLNSGPLPVSPREQVLKLIKELVESEIPNLRICVTSRPEADIEPILCPLALSSVSLHGENGQVQDIAEYVKFVVNTDPKMQKWREEDRRHVVEVLTKKADGMFRWVSCQLQYLRHCLRQRIRRALDELPDTLDETYNRTLEEIGKQNWEYAHRLFQCVAAASRPLRVEELAEFLAFDFDTDSTPTLRGDWREEDPAHAVRSTCSSLLSIVDVDGSSVIQFAHFSVKEYLTSKRLAESKDIISQFHVSMTLAHTIIARACLGVLLQIDENVTKDDLEKFPLAEYAAKHWAGHARFEGVSPNIKDGMKRLFDPNNHHLSVWVWIYDPDQMVGIRYMSERPSQVRVTSLHYAGFHGLHEVVEFLIAERSQNVNTRGLNRRETPLSVACRRGHSEVARVLLEHGADTETMDTSNYSPLERSSESGHVEVVRILLRNHANVNFSDEDNSTALHSASLSGHVGVARALLGNGADVNAKTTKNETPLHLADNEGVTRILLEYGADPNARNSDNRTPLHRAMRAGNADGARVLLENGVDANARDATNQTPLHVASIMGCRDGVRVLLQHSADIHARDDKGATPFRYASIVGAQRTIQLLLEHGAEDDRTS